MSDRPVYAFCRVIKAPRVAVWEAWSDPKLLAQWYGPGVETVIHGFDLRPGGQWRNEMRWNGKSDFSRMDFQDIKEGERMVWLHHATDADWQVATNPMMPDWPKVLLTKLTLADAGDGTLLQLSQAPVEASEAELACFADMMSGMDDGWGKGFDHMETLLAVPV